MLTAHKIANNIVKKKGVTFPFNVKFFEIFFFILPKSYVLERGSSSNKISKFFIQANLYYKLTYCLKASSLSLAIGCQKYSKTVCCPLIISTCAIMPGLSGTVLPLLSAKLLISSTSIAYI